MTSLTIKNLVKTYDQIETIHNLNLNILSGEFIVLVGPSGCGKSTILRMIAGLEEVTSGEIYIEDNNVTKIAASKRGIAMVFQSYALYPHMTVRENFGFGLKNMKCSKQYIEQQIQHAADILQLGDYLERLPSQLSGGQRQRVAIGRAIVRDPKIFLFDEPLSNLDAELRVRMRHELIKLHKKLDNTMIYVTHDQIEAMTMADRIVLLNEGNIVQIGSPLELYNHPENIFAANFIGSPKINLLKGKIIENQKNKLFINLFDNKKICLEVNLPTLNMDDEIILGLRPEHISTTVNNRDMALDLIVNEVESLGDATYIYAKLFDKFDFRVKLQGQHKFNSSDRLTLGIALPKILLFDAKGEAIHS